MSDEQNDMQPIEETPAALEPTTLELPEQVQQVRLGGQAGVRVRHSGEVTRTKAGQQSATPDCRAVPFEVLAAVKPLLEEETQLTAAEALRAARDLLSPWL